MGRSVIINKSTRRIFLICIVLFALGGVFSFLGKQVFMTAVPFCVFSFMCFCSVCIIYDFFAGKNIRYPFSRRYLRGAMILLVIWESLTLMEILVPGEDMVFVRAFWYLTYFPTTMIPSCVLLAIMHMDRKNREKTVPWDFIIFAISSALTILILTNDIHHQAFKFISMEKPFPEYTYGPAYYASIGWVFMQLLLAAFIIRGRTMNETVRKKIRWIYLMFVIVFAYFAWYIAGRPPAPWIINVYDVSEVWIAILLISLEYCFRSGLISANLNYIEFFANATISARIYDSSGLRYRSSNVIEASEEEREKALSAPVWLDEVHRLHSAKINGGSVFWVENLEEVVKATKELDEVRSQLTQEGDLIRAENEIIERRVKAEEQNRLYHMLAKDVKRQVDILTGILESTGPEDPDFDKKIARACIYKAYIKRYSNMRLLSRETGRIELFDLKSSIAESMNYLSLNGIEGNVTITDQCPANTELILLSYEIFERGVELCLPGLRKVSVEASCEGKYRILITCFTKGSAPDVSDMDDMRKKAWSFGWPLDIEAENETVFIRMETYGGAG